MSLAKDKNSNIQISYDPDKLEAVNFYLKYKGTSIEKEVLEAIEIIYKKSVPVQVREYIERKNLPFPETEQ